MFYNFFINFIVILQIYFLIEKLVFITSLIVYIPEKLNTRYSILDTSEAYQFSGGSGLILTRAVTGVIII